MIKKGLARAYARALIKSAKNDDQLKSFLRELIDIADVLRENKELYEMLMKPVLSNEKRKELLQKLINKMGLSSTIINLLNMLLQNYRLSYVEQIIKIIEEEIDRKEGIIRGEFISANNIDIGIINRAQENLSRLLGKKVLLVPKVQKEIIGGAIIKIGSLEIDGSVLRRINSIDNINIF